MPQDKSLKKNELRILLIFLAIILSLTLAESLFGILPLGEIGGSEVLVKKSDNILLSYELKPNFTRVARNPDGIKIIYRTNGYGFRGSEFQFERVKPALLFLGDSITFGFGVREENTFSGLVEKYLKLNHGLEFMAVNLGVGGYNTKQEIELYKQNVNQFSPSWVILGYALNDASFGMDWSWSDELGRISTFANSPSLLRNNGPAGKIMPALGFLDNLKIFRLPAKVLFKRGENQKIANSKPFGQEECEIYQREYSKDYTGDGWENRKHLLLDLKKSVEGNNQRFLLLIFPIACQVESSEFNNISDKIIAFAQDSEIDFIDFLQIFKSSGIPVENLFIDNPHFTDEGHDIVARSVSEYVATHRF